MPKIKFLGNWRREYHEEFNIPKGYLIIKYQDFYRRRLGETLLSLDKFQNEKYKQAEKKAIEKGLVEIPTEFFLRDLEIELNYHYKKRTLDQNALMWSLYQIEANELNGNQSGHKDQLIHPNDLYFSDLEEFGEIESITTKRKNLSYYMSEYKIIKSVNNNGSEIPLENFLKLNIDENQIITISVIRGSSKFNTREMANWIDRQFNRLAYNGVAVYGSGEIAKYWHDWKRYLDENKITLIDTIMTKEEYKSYTPICEACGLFIQEGEGDLAHIQSIGMGNNRTKEPKKNYTSNWLHLHREPCHLSDWHQSGFKTFLKKYKHLTYKVNTALKREYKPLSDLENVKSEEQEIFDLDIF